jgi:hypothetical protein
LHLNLACFDFTQSLPFSIDKVIVSVAVCCTIFILFVLVHADYQRDFVTCSLVNWGIPKASVKYDLEPFLTQ